MAGETPSVPGENPERGNITPEEAASRFSRMAQNMSIAAEDLLDADPTRHARVVGAELTPILVRHLGAAFPHLSPERQDELMELFDAIKWSRGKRS